MKTTTYKLDVTFITPVLGSQSTKQITSTHIAKRSGFALPEDEEQTLPDALEAGTTVFSRDAKENPIIVDYTLKGLLKEAGKVFNGKVTGNVKNLRSKIVQYVFVSPRFIKLVLPKGFSIEDIDYFERPLRAETAQGPRVALARSEQLPEGTTFTCGLEVFPSEITEEVLRELLDYGFYSGLCQFRGGGFGRFTYKLTKED